jgi:uncharacterized coiled-coil DUF342 family protein
MTQATDTDILKRLDTIASDIQDIKITLARTDERFNSIDQRFNSMDQRFTDLNKRIDSLEQRNIAQDVRFWGFLGIIVTALIGLLSKLAFFPGGAA